MFDKNLIKKINDNFFEINHIFNPKMRVPARFFASDEMLEKITKDRSLFQLSNVATLPGILKQALAMPDIHEGYGFPIGGVAAFDLENGIISPGGVGYDINCGVRLLTSSVTHHEIKDKLLDFMNQLQRSIPSGVGSSGALKVSHSELNAILTTGLNWALKKNYAVEDDLLNSESRGCIKQASADKVSDRAKHRGYDQLGTLGSGNHFLEVQKVIEIFDDKIARSFNLFLDQIVIMIHTGSRGLGHQVCTDYVRLFNQKLTNYKLNLPDRELACAPIKSPEGQNYLAAMSAAANFAWVNRQLITYFTRRVWHNIFQRETNELKLLYDVAHNMAKIEEHEIDKNFIKQVCIHRKGATRAFPAGHPELPEKYQITGQPVLIPGSMGTSSYVLVGDKRAMTLSFGSVNHGAGRTMSRGEAKHRVFASQISLKKQLEAQGIIIRCRSAQGLAEEAPLAYKDVDAVVNVVTKAGLAKKIAQLKPLGVLKGE